MSNIKLSVVIPAFNEEKNLQDGVLDEVDNYLRDQKYHFEVLIVDDGSADRTADLVEKIIKNKPIFKLIRNPHGGKANTVITGMLEAVGDIVLFTDMDQATPINQIEIFFPMFEKGFDIVIGSRGGRKGAPLIRKFNAWGFSLLRNIILGLPLTDTQCGFKAFKQAAAQLVFSKMQQMRKRASITGAALNAGFDVELLYYAKKNKLKITEVPVDWHYVGTPRFRLFHDALEALKDMFKIRLNDWKGLYG